MSAVRVLLELRTERGCSINVVDCDTTTEANTIVETYLNDATAYVQRRACILYDSSTRYAEQLSSEWTGPK